MSVETDRIQLGVIRLPLHEQHDAESSSMAASRSSWQPVTEEIIRSGFLARLSPAEEMINVFCGLLADPGISFDAEYRIVGLNLVVRCSLIPSDGRGADWRRRTKVDRSKLLKKLFFELRSEWDGDEGGNWLLASRDEDRYRVNDLYALVPSPSAPTAEDWAPRSLGDEDTQSRLICGGDLKGLKSTLYKYQIRSVNRMIQMEMEPGRLVDPRFTEFQQADRKGQSFYVNLTNFDVQLFPGRYDLPRGGILCEQMGVGKTLICLSLVLATLHQPAQPPPHDIDLSPILTDHMLHTYPFRRMRAIREDVSLLTRLDLAVPTLSELCANILACRDHSVDLAFSAVNVDPGISALIHQRTFYYKYPPDTSCMRTAKARKISGIADKIFLSNTTLVAVPPILVDQWMQEIEKHVELGVLKVLKVDGELPHAARLLEYDIILMDVNRLGREDALSRLRLNLPPSKLLDVRWKRIILGKSHMKGTLPGRKCRTLCYSLDRSMWSGHGRSQALQERQAALAGQHILYACSRRLATASYPPTKHLQQGGEDHIVSLKLRSTAEAVNSQSMPPSLSTATAWGRRDLDDVSRFGVIISSYLGTQPFRSDLSFSESVTAHLRRRNIPFGAVRRLRYLMDALMVKHRVHEIDIEASLPPVTIETVVIPFEPMQRLTYNVLASLIVGNVYACNFEDEDYFLHPRNAKAFRQVVQNLHIACTWFGGTQMGAVACLERLRDDLEHNTRLTDEARSRMVQAVDHLERAIGTPGWSEWVRHGMSLPIYAPDLPPEVRGAWSASRSLETDWVDVHSLTALRDKNKNGTTLQELVEAGQKAIDKAVQHALSEDLAAEEVRAKKVEKSAKTGHTLAQSNAASRPKAAFSRRGGAHKKAKAQRDEADETDKAIALAMRNAQLATEEQARSHLPRPLEDAIMVKTRSHKMNHVVKSIRDSSTEDKFVIFGDTAELGHCTEILEFFDISWVFAGGSSSAKARVDAIDSFQRSDIKACLLDIKVAARGLNLVVANRMILLAPMWSLDTQAQAIKRIHRIGQTRSTKIEILVTEGTFEEDIAKRASTSRTEQEEKLYTRQLIEHPRFVHVERETDDCFVARMRPSTTNTGPELGPLVESSPGAASTPDTNIVTPFSVASASSGAPRLDLRDTSPTPTNSAPSLKRPLGAELAERHDGESENPTTSKKKARVTFA